MLSDELRQAYVIIILLMTKRYFTLIKILCFFLETIILPFKLTK